MYPGSILFIARKKRDQSLPGRLLRLDHRAFTAVAVHRNRAGDMVLPRLSRAADNSILWIVAAILMAGFGGRRGRRAAVRGIGSILIASLTVNQGAKRLARRPRPPLRNVPATRRLKSVPLTTSFPSGHSASAAAFTTAVFMEWPAAGRLIAPIAGLVAYSRVYVGVHYPGDVIVGVMAGTGIARLTRLLDRAGPP